MRECRWGASGSRSRAAGVAAVGLVAMLVGLLVPGSAVATAGTGLPAGSPQRPGSVTGELQAALDEVVAAGASGVLLRVDDGRRSYRLAAGKARLDQPQKLRPEARFRVGSITKTFVSTLVLQLVGEGRLGLDDPVERWQPGLIPNGSRITIRQLLNHTSGLFNYTDDPTFLAQVQADPTAPWTPQQLIDLANAQPPVFAPGTSWSYSNTNYVVAGLVLERVTRQPVARLLEQRIIQPLRLRNTYLAERSPDIAGYHAHGYAPPSLTGAGYLDQTRLSPTVAWTAGALISNVDDLRRFYRALLGGRLLPPAQLAQMKELVPVPGGEGFGYGLGLYSAETPCGTIWGHDGGIPGYATIAWHDETGRRGVELGLPTDSDEQIGAAFSRLIDVATCRAFGQEPPAPSVDTGARAKGSAGTSISAVLDLLRRSSASDFKMSDLRMRTTG